MLITKISVHIKKKDFCDGQIERTDNLILGKSKFMTVFLGMGKLSTELP